MMWHGDWSGADWLFMSFGMLVFWGVVVAGIVLLLRNTGSTRTGGDERGVDLTKPSGTARTNAREILDQRFARGEIGDEEYRSRRDTLASP